MNEDPVLIHLFPFIKLLILQKELKKKPLFNIEKFKSNIFLKTVSVLSVAVSIRMVLICGCTFLLTGACRS